MRIDDAAGGEVVKTFATLILDTKLDGDTQMDIISALGDYGGKAFAAEPVLIKLALLPNQRLRIPAAIALAEINPEAAIRAGVQLSDLFEPAKFRLEETEIAVIRAIGKTRKPSAEFLKCLRLAAKDKSPEISREADAALKRIASREATQAGGK